MVTILRLLMGALRDCIMSRGRLAPAIGVGAAVRDQALAEQTQHALAGVVVLTDDVEELARRDMV
jgi:hypothetical protein